MSDPRFPGAPRRAFVCEEGWLIVDDQAWTEEEWRQALRHSTTPSDGRPRHPRTPPDPEKLIYGRRYATDLERSLARQRSRREYMRRRRSATA